MLKNRPQTIILIAINIAIFLAMGFFGSPDDPEFMIKCGALYPSLVTEGGQWWRLVTACFLHYDISHLMNNMLMLAAVGNDAEGCMKKLRFLFVYMLTGIIGNAVTIAAASITGDYSVSAGASGAVFGLTGALLAIAIKNGGRVLEMPHEKSDSSVDSPQNKLTIRGVLLMIVLAVFAGVTSTGVNNTAHVAGLIAGVILTLFLYKPTNTPGRISSQGDPAPSEVVPEFYFDFACKADTCRHTCCAGWEIDIDDTTAGRYQSMNGAPGDKLRASIEEGPDGWHFVMKNGRCPMLTSDGLCEIILQEGEEALCDICALHPRFYGEIGSTQLTGLGDCCEKTAELLTASDQRLLFVDTTSMRAHTLPALCEILGLSFMPEQLSYTPTTDPEYCRGIAARFKDTEPIDEAWPREMDRLASDLETDFSKINAFAAGCNKGVYQRIYDYILYRRLEDYPEYGPGPLAEFAKVNTDFILMTHALYGDLPERLRRWSEQIEYSDVNSAL